MSELAYEVRRATKEDVTSILADKGIAARLGKKKIEEITDSDGTFLLSYKSYYTIFTYEALTIPGLYEVHIACPTSSIRASRLLCLSIIDWVLKGEGRKGKGIVTSCPEGKIANLVRKLGFQEVGVLKDELVFIYLLR